ncbi:CheF family chemotaxis protein [Halorientalis salina]|uniref:CheF family chemotaxis protein n=1 Tax=Halorientalis salina TaxID=2932266 RepID=UPI0010AD1DBA|nr:CheF family chemotaxis protein [Halorientalis salina]
MSESVIADFVGKFNTSTAGRAEPVQGRVLLSKKRLVLATDGDKLTVPLSNVFDVAVGKVPQDFGAFFDSTVTIAFNTNGNRHIAAVEASDEKIEKFSTVLFKALLNGTTMMVKHPAQVGGRVTGENFYSAKLTLKRHKVEFTGTDAAFTVDLSTVTNFEEKKREIAGSTRQVLSVRHMDGGQAVTSLAAIDSARKMSLLGRYLRLEYSDIIEDLEDVDLSEEETELLVAVYSSDPGVSLASVLGKEPSQVTMMLNDLIEKDLIRDGGETTQLTAKGRIIVSSKLEDVNA